MQKNQNYSWYAIYTRSRAEKKVHEALCNANIDCYLPLRKVKKQWSDRVKTVEEPVLPGYIFVKVSKVEYFDALNVPGALMYVYFEGKAAKIPESQIIGLQKFTQYFNDQMVVDTSRINIADRVEVVAGPLKGVVGEVVEIRGKERLLLRFGNLGYTVHVEMNSEWLKHFK